MKGLQAKRLWLNAFLLLLVVGLGWVAWWWQEQSGEVAGVGLLDLAVPAVTRIEVDRHPENPGIDVLAFDKLENRWQMTMPKALPANTLRVRQLLTLLEESVAASYPAKDQELAQYGLAPGQVLVRFNKELVVLGAANQVSDRRYVLHDGQIKLLAESVFGNLTGSWLDFVSLKLVPEDFGLTGVELPTGQTASADVLTSWKAVEAVSVDGLDPATVGADLPLVRLKSATQVRELRVLDRSDELVLGDVAGGVRYILPADLAAGLLAGTVQAQ